MEYEPSTSTPLIASVSCPIDNRPEGKPKLWGKMKIKLISDSLAFRIYQKPEIEEWFQCNYELNPAFQGKIETTGLELTGLGDNGEARIIELPDNNFFLATNFQPQLMSEEGKPHPLVIAYLEACMGK